MLGFVKRLGLCFGWLAVAVQIVAIFYIFGSDNVFDAAIHPWAGVVFWLMMAPYLVIALGLLWLVFDGNCAENPSPNWGRRLAIILVLPYALPVSIPLATIVVAGAVITGVCYGLAQSVRWLFLGKRVPA